MEWKPRRDVMIRNKVRDVTFGRVLYSLRREAWRRGIGRTRRYVRYIRVTLWGLSAA